MITLLLWSSYTYCIYTYSMLILPPSINKLISFDYQKSNYRQRKVFSVPMAHNFLSRVNNTITNGTRHAGLWAWADPKRCDPYVYLNNPWACNFIPFTNCSNRAKTIRAEIKPIDLVPWERYVHSFYTCSLCTFAK